MIGWLAMCLTALLPSDDAVPEAVAPLQGAWRLVSIEVDGRALDPFEVPARLVIQGDKVGYGGRDLATLKADPGAMPKVVDLGLLRPSRVLEGIFSVEGDTLRFCLNKRVDGVKERPTVFATAGKADWRLLTFERDKPGGDADDGVRGYIGVALRTDEATRAVVVNSLLEGSAAEEAGLREGDVVVKIGGQQVADLQSAVEAVRREKPGRMLALLVRRDGEEVVLKARVGVIPFTLLADLI